MCVHIDAKLRHYLTVIAEKGKHLNRDFFIDVQRRSATLRAPEGGPRRFGRAY